ncbi:hypothetical protein COCON_G00084650 [Conger conger]|uniref:Uncharacterized protein n=1 Tax=Conger conger TaxID=82655 RepID=A0A9Q1I2X0_CONCO|nr:hypothetical protein COCON_G00084650 [Conger conger]
MGGNTTENVMFQLSYPRSRNFESKNSDDILHCGYHHFLCRWLHVTSPDGLLHQRLENAADCHGCSRSFQFPHLEVHPGVSSMASLSGPGGGRRGHFERCCQDEQSHNPGGHLSASPGTYYKSLPYILMGSLCVFGGLLSLLLPETYGMPLPETIDHMQTIQRCKKKQTSNII